MQRVRYSTLVIHEFPGVARSEFRLLSLWSLRILLSIVKGWVLITGLHLFRIQCDLVSSRILVGVVGGAGVLNSGCSPPSTCSVPHWYLGRGLTVHLF